MPETKTLEQDQAEPDIKKIEKREKVLREKILLNMPTKWEMKRCPFGAVKKHQNWEAKNRERLPEWKKLRTLMYPDEPKMCMVEAIRPPGMSVDSDLGKPTY